jgi:putative tryptophan/tyrosine transport system substrate-binding protein
MGFEGTNETVGIYRGRDIGRRRRITCCGTAAGVSQRLAIFSPSESSTLMHEKSDNRYYRTLFEELRRLGHVEGQNLTVERYGSEQNRSGAEVLAADVIRSNPDVVFLIGPGAPIFKKADAKFPIVTLTADPIAQGLAQSLARPGGNITGVSVDTGPSIHGKRIALLHEMFPAMSKLAFLTLRVAWQGVQRPPVRAAAEMVGITLVPLLVDSPASEDDYRSAIAQALRDGADAIMIGDAPDVIRYRSLILELIGAARLPAIFPFFELVEAGGLMAYAFDLVELNKRVANDIDAILRGANPGEIPFYQATKFELSINLRTAKVLGLNVPATLLASADRVIE